ncbi:MAG TPA: enoyl-CoA hydratase-related protein [Jatrophihabitans sp.]|nr:enoyl-CoA hydratase-related protein [Jatrophihabitans sp.]
MSLGYLVRDGVATLTLDAPERRNALSAELLGELSDRLDQAAADPTVRCLVLSHTGPAFCSGMDLTTVTDLPAERQPINAFPVLLQRIWEFDKPVIGRVDGKARAGGIGLIAACDIALASPAADFAFTEVRLGLVPAVISVPLLPRMTNRALLELCLTGETFDAAVASRAGLLNRVCADSDELDREVARYAAMLRLCEPNALAATKTMLRRDRSGLSMAEDFAAMGRLSAGYFAGPQAAEGIAAFRAKRPPSWAAPAED